MFTSRDKLRRRALPYYEDLYINPQDEEEEDFFELYEAYTDSDVSEDEDKQQNSAAVKPNTSIQNSNKNNDNNNSNVVTDSRTVTNEEVQRARRTVNQIETRQHPGLDSSSLLTCNDFQQPRSSEPGYAIKPSVNSRHFTPISPQGQKKQKQSQTPTRKKFGLFGSLTMASPQKPDNSAGEALDDLLGHGLTAPTSSTTRSTSSDQAPKIVHEMVAVAVPHAKATSHHPAGGPESAGPSSELSTAAAAVDMDAIITALGKKPPPPPPAGKASEVANSSSNSSAAPAVIGAAVQSKVGDEVNNNAAPAAAHEPVPSSSQRRVCYRRNDGLPCSTLFPASQTAPTGQDVQSNRPESSSSSSPDANGPADTTDTAAAAAAAEKVDAGPEANKAADDDDESRPKKKASKKAGRPPGSGCRSGKAATEDSVKKDSPERKKFVTRAQKREEELGRRRLTRSMASGPQTPVSTPSGKATGRSSSRRKAPARGTKKMTTSTPTTKGGDPQDKSNEEITADNTKGPEKSKRQSAAGSSKKSTVPSKRSAASPASMSRAQLRPRRNAVDYGRPEHAGKGVVVIPSGEADAKEYHKVK